MIDETTDRAGVLEASTEVAAPPERVWELVSDVARTGEWSPECRRVFLLGATSPAAGVRFVGINRRDWAVWPTVSRIVRFEPGRAIAWRTRESGATWSYELEAVDSGTRVVERRELPRGYSRMTRAFGPLIGGATQHDAELEHGMRETLARIKAAAER